MPRPTMAVDTSVRPVPMVHMATPLASALLMLRPTMVPAMAAMVDTAVVFTDTARGPLMPRPTTAPATAMAAMVDTAMAAMVHTARGLLMPRPTTAPATAMAAMAVTVTAVAMPGASKS